MNNQQKNEAKRAEKNLRKAEEIATDDGMPVAPSAPSIPATGELHVRRSGLSPSRSPALPPESKPSKPSKRRSSRV